MRDGMSEHDKSQKSSKTDKKSKHLKKHKKSDSEEVVQVEEPLTFMKKL